jgi:hypothetical protein
MSTIFTRSDGLYISTHATWPQLATDESLRHFANGLIPTALHHEDTSWTLAEVLHHTGPQTYPLLTALLILDAEVNAIVDDKQPVFPLPGFLTYRSKLSLDKFPLKTIRLPPINPNAHYILTTANGGFCAAVRIDLHSGSKMAGHVRIAISSLSRSPTRLQALEQCLEGQVLTKKLVQGAIEATDEDLLKPLSEVEQIRLAEVLGELINERDDLVKK